LTRTIAFQTSALSRNRSPNFRLNPKNRKSENLDKKKNPITDEGDRVWVELARLAGLYWSGMDCLNG